MSVAPPPPYAEPTNGAYVNWSDNIDENEEYKYSFEIPEKPTPAPAYEDAFPIETPKYNDVSFTYTFIATLLGLAFLTYNSYKSSSSDIISFSLNTDGLSKGTKALYTLVLVSTITPVLISVSLLILVYCFPMVFLIIGFLLVPLSMFSIAGTMITQGAIFPSLIFGALGIFSLLFMFQNFNRFSFSALMIKLVVNAMNKYPSTIFISILSSLITCIISLVYMVSLIIIVNARITNDDMNCPHTNGNDICLSNTSSFVILFAIFSGCYIFQVLQNTVHVILSGIFSSWYFFDTYDSTVKPKSPALGSMKRAFTYCFGSICFGSLIVSIIQTIRISLQVLKSKMQNARFQRDRDNQMDDSGLLFCFLICIVSILEWIANEFEYWLQWFNRYAYSYLSMYGKPYYESAKDTFEILKYKGIDILINDSLISTAISLYSILSIIITAVVLQLTINFSTLLNEMGPEMLILGGIGSMIICWFIVSSTINVLDVGCVTFMIGLSVDPDAFTRTNAGTASDASIQRLQVWEQMVRYYPGIRERVAIPWPQN